MSARLERLALLSPEGLRLVTPALASGEVAQWPAEAWSDLVDVMPRTVSLTGMHALADDVATRFERFDTAIDAYVAPRLHQALALTRREAADPRLWRFLAVIARPDLVRHRWENASWLTMRARFVSPGTRPDSNAFSRWWWIAELTRRGSDYGLTERVLQRQALCNAIFIRSLSFHREAVAACVAELELDPPEVIERMLLELNRWLSVVPLEGLSEADLTRRLRELRRR